MSLTARVSPPPHPLVQALHAEWTNPADKADIYGQLGLELTYHPAERKIEVKARPASMYVRKVRGSTRRLHTYLR